MEEFTSKRIWYLGLALKNLGKKIIKREWKDRHEEMKQTKKDIHVFA